MDAELHKITPTHLAHRYDHSNKATCTLYINKRQYVLLKQMQQFNATVISIP